MGNASRKRKHGEKMSRRRAAKAAKKAKYLALAGTSKKAKRQKTKHKMISNKKHAHVMANCGNVGCKRCFPLGGTCRPQVSVA